MMGSDKGNGPQATRGTVRAIAESGYNYFVGHEFKPKGEVYEALRGAFVICDQGA